MTPNLGQMLIFLYIMTKMSTKLSAFVKQYFNIYDRK